MPTGGVSTQPDSIAGLLAGGPVDHRALHAPRGRELRAHVPRVRPAAGPRVLVRDEELRLYVALAWWLRPRSRSMVWGYGISEGEEAIRAGVFQAVSILTTTGLRERRLRALAGLLLLTLFALMFVGGSAGSTSGSIKVVRHLLLGKVLRRELDQTVSPEVVMPIRLNGAPVDERTLRAIAPSSFSTSAVWAVGAAASPSTPRSPTFGLGDARRRSAPRRPRSATWAPASGSPARSARSLPLGDVSQDHDDPAHVRRPARDHPRRRPRSPVTTGASSRAASPLPGRREVTLRSAGRGVVRDDREHLVAGPMTVPARRAPSGRAGTRR